jgi:hypothetical protein
MRNVTKKQFFSSTYLFATTTLLATAIMVLLLTGNWCAFLAMTALLVSLGACNYLGCECENLCSDYIDEVSDKCSLLKELRDYLEIIEKQNKKIKELEK